MSRPELKDVLDSRTSYEEGDVVDYDTYADQKSKPSEREAEYHYQEYQYAKPTQSEFEQKKVTKSKLFDTKKTAILDDSIVEDEDLVREPSILVTGFGMRNVDSFQKLIKMSQEERKKWELRKLWRDQHGQSIKSKEEEKVRSRPTSARPSARTVSTEASTSTRSDQSSTDFLTQTETTVKTGALRDEIKQLDYLMGLEAEAEEEGEPFGEMEMAELEDEFKYSSSKPVREAQRYLRVHRIFECFQFLVAHLLSARAENPIELILNLLNRCLLYRSGLGNAPLLYEHKHIEKLFDLMDRLQTGFIDLRQYVAGMKTLGICTYNEEPEVNEDGQVTKDTFVEEVYEAELAIFQDLIRRRPEKNKQKFKKTPSGFGSVSVPSLNPPFFIPSDLFKLSSKTKIDVIDFVQGE